MRTHFLSLSLVALLFVGAGCATSGSLVAVPTPAPAPAPTGTTPPPSESPTASFDTEVSFTVGQSMTFQDGIRLTLTTINDSRCKPGVQCIWAGELSAAFTFQGKDGASQEIMLGTLRVPQATVDGHTISLKRATTQQATITVSKP